MSREHSTSVRRTGRKRTEAQECSAIIGQIYSNVRATIDGTMKSCLNDSVSAEAAQVNQKQMTSTWQPLTVLAIQPGPHGAVIRIWEHRPWQKDDGKSNSTPFSLSRNVVNAGDSTRWTTHDVLRGLARRTGLGFSRRSRVQKIVGWFDGHATKIRATKRPFQRSL